jgi:O-antigen ligase
VFRDKVRTDFKMLKMAIDYFNFSMPRDNGERVLWVLVFLFPILVNFRHGVSTVFGLIVFTSIYMLIQKRPRLNQFSKYMLAGFIVFIVISLLSFINVDDFENSIRRIKKLAYFIFLIPILMAMTTVRVNLVKPFIAGVCIAGFVLLGIAIHESDYFSITGRVTGFYQAIMFGSIAVVNALALFVSFLVVKQRKMHLSIILLSFVGSLIAAFMSGTRGAWLAMLVCIPIGIVFSAVGKEMRKTRIYLLLISSILLVSVIGILNEDSIRRGYEIQPSDTQQIARNAKSSIGQRLALWRAAVKIWHGNPIIGTGIGDFKKDFAEMRKSGEVEFLEGLPAYNYAHSTFLEALACIGILGLIALIVSTFLLPFLFFLKALKIAANEYDKYAAVFGLVFVTAFMILGLTENWLVHLQLIKMFTILLAIMACRFSSETG